MTLDAAADRVASRLDSGTDEMRRREFLAMAGGERPLPDSADPPAGAGAFGDLDDETAAELRELGYLRE